MSAPDRVILSVKLASGDFESSVTVLIDASKMAKDKAIMDWLAMVAVCLERGVTAMDAVLTGGDGNG